MTDDTRVGQWPYRVRYDECGPDGHLRTSVFLRWAQDLASHHSTLLGFDRDWYRQHRDHPPSRPRLGQDV